MLILITYDVNTESKDGQRRLRKVAKACVNHGQRVQNSLTLLSKVVTYVVRNFID